MILIIQNGHQLIKEEIGSYYHNNEIVIDIINKTIVLDNNYYFLDGSKTKNLNYQKYEIKEKGSYEIKTIFIYDEDVSLTNYKIYDKRDFIISNNKNSTIVTSDPFLKEYYLVLRNGMLETNYDGLVYNYGSYNDVELVDGDYIEFLGFSFFYYSDFLYINDFLVNNHLPLKEINEKILEHKTYRPKINNYYEESYNDIEIETIETFSPPNRNNARKLILQMGPALTMSLAMMLVAGINVYNSYLTNGYSLTMIALIAMPVTMLLSGVMWPIITSTTEKKSFKKEYDFEKNNYLDYLKEYEERLIINIKRFIKYESNYMFLKEDVKSRLFYVSKNSNKFLNITLGYRVRSIDIAYKTTKDKQINEYLHRIKYRLANIDNCPLYLDLKKNRRVSFITSLKSKKYYLYKTLLELSYKYSYEDINIAIYSKDDSLFNDIYALPHLFIDKTRLTLINERELQDINSLKIIKPLIVLMHDYSDFIFSSDNIHCIYFSSNPEIILKESDSVIELFDEDGILNHKEKIKFKHYEDEIDFKNYFEYISLFNNVIYINEINTFSLRFPGLNVEKFYQDKGKSLKADFAIIGQETLEFDLHETKDGPHGLIGGSTGSGKSELIISLLLSLVIRYRPDYLNIILIDYKGGGIEESLSYNQESIPHIIASISNLEEDTFERLIIAISRECKKRQKLFKELSSKSKSSIMNIDDYLEINDKYEMEKIAHLLIVVDEFAELKKENPYIIKELISFSRIGRSLGLHLILATQRPSGVIDEEIWSNSHFKIALKVHSEKDSIDIIKTKEAATLFNPGEFYLNVDDKLVRAKTIYSKCDVNNNDNFEVCLLDNKLNVVSKKSYKKDNPFMEANYIAYKIIDESRKLNIHTNIFDFEKPKSLSTEELKDKYRINSSLILGEIDDYLNAYKNVLSYNLDDNLLIYSNRKKEINNILNTLNANKRQSIVISNNHYIGGFISDSLNYDDDEDIVYLFNKLLKDEKTPVHLVIEDLNTLLSYNEDYLNYIYKLLRRSSVSNLTLDIITSISNINFKILNSFKNKIAIDIYDTQDLINIFSSKGQHKGGSYYFDETPITFIPARIDDFIFFKNEVEEYIEHIPNRIEYEIKNNSVLIGIDIKTRERIYLKDNESLLITSTDQDVLSVLMKIYQNNKNIYVVPYDKHLINNKFNNIVWVKDGLYNQRIFYVDRDYSLDINEGYFYKNNKGKIIKMVNYE